MQMRRLIIILLIILGYNCFSQEKITIYRPYLVFDNEVLIPIRIKNPDKFLHLKELADSLISQDENGYTLNFIDFDLEIKNLDFQNVQVVLLFDKLNNQIGVAKFNHFEYYENTIEGLFISTYKLIDKQKLNGEIYYCINEDAKVLLNNDLAVKEIKPFITPSSKSKSTSPELLFEAYAGYWSKKDSAKIIMLSCEKPVPDDEIRKFKNIVFNGIHNEDVKLIETIDFYAFTEFCITKVILNGKPILLFRTAIPDTDFEDFTCYYWDKNNYILSNNTINYK